MYKPLSFLFKNHQSVPLTEEDIRHLIQEYLRRQLKSEAVYCEKVQTGCATVRVGSPGLQQAAKILEYDIQQTVKKESGYTVVKLTVKCD